ncbi:hypothetical protein GWG67_37825 [Bradyrhizobium sp. CSS354]|nr:hypothetical protein [Bradyrhizobium sp. CSS354]
MKQYVGLDVSQRETAVCVVNETGQVVVREQGSKRLSRSQFSGWGGI